MESDVDLPNHESSPMLRCLIGLDTPDTKGPKLPLRTGSAWVAHTYPGVDDPAAGPGRTPHPTSGQAASLPPHSTLPSVAFHHSTSFVPSSPLSNNPPGPLTLLPDNPPNLPARRATHVSLTFRSSDSPNLPTAISNRMPQACIRRMQRRRLHNRTS